MIKDLCFEIIESCPNHCKFCSSCSSIVGLHQISFEDFKRVIDYAIEHGGIKELSLSGGEPFLHPDLFRFVRYATSKNIPTVIFTSGVKVRPPLEENIKEYYERELEKHMQEILEHEPWNERLMKNITNYYENFLHPPKFGSIGKDEFQKLKEWGVQRIVFDFQGYQEETDAYLMERRQSFHQYLLDSILAASFSGLNVDIHFIPMKPNYQEVREILELLEIPKIQNFSILRFVPQGRGREYRDSLELSKEELKTFFALLQDCHDVFSGNIRRSISFLDTSHQCNAGLEKLNIKADGTILPCPAMKDVDAKTCKKYGIKIGNIYENLELLNIPGNGTRGTPLCRRIYRFPSNS